MIGARILLVMLLFNFFTIVFGYEQNTILQHFLIIDKSSNTVLISDSLLESVERDLESSQGSTVTSNIVISTFNPLAYIWNFLVFLTATLLAPLTIFGYGLPLEFAVPLFLIWFIPYLFAFIALLRGVSF